MEQVFKYCKHVIDFYFESLRIQREQNDFCAETVALVNYHYPITDVRNDITLELAII